MESLVTLSKDKAVQGMEMFLRNFSFVPDDKLNWAPTPSARSPLQIAAHTALYAGRFAEMIENRKLPVVENVEEWMARIRSEEDAVTSRSEVEPLFKAGTDRVLVALDSLSPDEINLRMDSGQGWSMPMTFLMDLPGWHATLHTGQIDYLQTCWGDQQIYVG